MNTRLNRVKRSLQWWTVLLLTMRLFVLATLEAAAAPAANATEGSMSDLQKAFDLSARLAQIDTRLLRAVCWVESGHRPNVRVPHDGPHTNTAHTTGSSAAVRRTIGASYGICQLKLQTARDMGFTGSAKELMQPHLNTYYAAQYLRYQLDRYRGNVKKAIKAYNRGHCRGSTNCEYVRRVMRAYREGR